MSDVYIVTSGIYSDYGIDQVFKSREKAELYCECHEGCEIEEWDFNDDNIYTVYDSVNIQAFLCPKTHGRSVKFSFEKHSVEDEPSKRDGTYVWIIGSNLFDLKSHIYREKKIEIVLDRELPKNYSEDKVKWRYERLIEDLAAEIEYEFSDVNNLEDGVVEEFVKRRLGVKESEYEE